MERCLQLARNGLGHVAPNPMVGCVIVHKERIIGEGFHTEYGSPHAEVNAIASVQDQALLKEATLYVNLEPCAHHGKTPPCADLIIKKGIPEVVVGCRDPFLEVDGKGIEKLEAAGVKVTVGILEAEALELNRRFMTFHQKKRPYVMLKWAQTLDGFMDKMRNDDVGINWISGPAAKRAVHLWRSQEQAIMVGTNTALVDDPHLNVREVDGKDPLRIIIDRELKIPAESHVLDGSIPTVVFTEKEAENRPNVEYVLNESSKDLLNEILAHLYNRGVQSVIIEGGRKLLMSFLVQDKWDEARVIIGTDNFGRGLQAPVIAKRPIKKDKLGEDILLTYRNA